MLISKQVLKWIGELKETHGLLSMHMCILSSPQSTIEVPYSIGHSQATPGLSNREIHSTGNSKIKCKHWKYMQKDMKICGIKIHRERERERESSYV